MASQLVEGIELVLDSIASFASLYGGQLFNTLLATTVFVLGYSLVRLGLQRLPTGSGRPTAGEYARLILPGAGFAVLGTIFLLRGDPALLHVALLTLAVGAGLGAVTLGCTLIAKSLAQSGEDVDVWDDKRILLTRSAPGIFLAATGLVTTVVALSILPDRFGDYSLERRQTRQEVVNTINSRLDEALSLLKHYIDERPGETAAEVPEPLPE